MLSQIKQFFKNNEGDVILVVGIILISLISFGAGWLMGTSSSMEPKSVGEIKIEEMFPENLKAEADKAEAGEAEETEKNEKQEKESKSNIKEDEEQNEDVRQDENHSEKKIVASRNGEVYYYIWCKGVKRIKEENKKYFNSKEEAEAAGYRPAKNCEGLE